MNIYISNVIPLVQGGSYSNFGLKMRKYNKESKNDSGSIKKWTDKDLAITWN